MELLIFILGAIYLAVRDLVDAHKESKKWDNYAAIYEAAARKNTDTTR